MDTLWAGSGRCSPSLLQDIQATMGSLVGTYRQQVGRFSLATPSLQGLHVWALVVPEPAVCPDDGNGGGRDGVGVAAGGRVGVGGGDDGGVGDAAVGVQAAVASARRRKTLPLVTPTQQRVKFMPHLSDSKDFWAMISIWPPKITHI